MDKFQITDQIQYTLLNKRQTIRKCRYRTIDSPALGEIIIPSHKKFNGRWTIKVDKCYEPPIMIGIFCTSNDDIFYVYTGKNMWSGLRCKRYGYGHEFVTDDIIGIHLIIDDNKQQLSFHHNKMDLGIACNKIKTGKDIQYRFGVSMFEKDGQVTIMDFKTT